VGPCVQPRVSPVSLPDPLELGSAPLPPTSQNELLFFPTRPASSLVFQTVSIGSREQSNLHRRSYNPPHSVPAIVEGLRPPFNLSHCADAIFFDAFQIPFSPLILKCTGQGASSVFPELR